MIVDRPGLERLERDLPLAIIFEPQAVEIVLAKVDRQLRSPIAGVARIFDEPALLERLDLVGAGAERRVERRGGEIAPAPPCRREHRHADDNQMRVARAPFDKAHVDDVVPFRIRRLHLFQKLGVDRVALLLEHIEREGDVGSLHLRSVEEARLGSEAEAVIELVGRNPDGLGEQTVDRIRLVAVGGHQGVESGRHAGRAVALPGIDVEGVEGVEVLVAARAGDLQREQAAGRGLGIDVGEMRKVGRERQIAERRQAMGLGRIVGKRGERAGGERRERGERAGFQRRPAGQGYGHRIVNLAALRGVSRLGAHCQRPRRKRGGGRMGGSRTD